MAIVVFVGTEEELKANRGRVALTFSQTAARLHLGERQLQRLVSTGEISPYEEQLGPIRFFEEPDVERLRVSRLKRY